MLLGMALPNHMPYRLQSAELIEWARLADEAGFATLATLDRPNYDGWDPLITLAGVAPITKHASLSTAILQLPNRNEIIVAKQAAVIDQLSGGRLELGLGVGSRPDDYDVLGAPFDDRGERFAGQVRRIREVWGEAIRSDASWGALGPAPTRDPAFLWIGATTKRTMTRATKIGDGLMLSGTNDLLDRLPELLPWVKASAAESGKSVFPVSRIVYVAVTTSPSVRGEALQNLQRFYERWAWAPVETMIDIGSVGAIREMVAAHAEAGLDLLILIPEVRDLRQVAILAEEVLPAYRASISPFSE
jgi:alkanesulfonate monooxygenase SsuD/methylene tetrahydromethanopterin reductase-like flavin-dependent oxidoreductase (luciferase family)